MVNYNASQGLILLLYSNDVLGGLKAVEDCADQFGIKFPVFRVYLLTKFVSR